MVARANEIPGKLRLACRRPLRRPHVEIHDALLIVLKALVDTIEHILL